MIQEPSSTKRFPPQNQCEIFRREPGYDSFAWPCFLWQGFPARASLLPGEKTARVFRLDSVNSLIMPDPPETVLPEVLPPARPGERQVQRRDGQAEPEDSIDRDNLRMEWKELQRHADEALAVFLSFVLDRCFTIPGTKIRFGLDPVIGMIPGAGDLITNLAGGLIIMQGRKVGVPWIVQVRMMLNLLLNTIIGAIPLVGDAFSVFFQSNSRNLALMRQYRAGEQQQVVRSSWLAVFVIFGILGAVTAGAIWVTVRLAWWLWGLATQGSVPV